MTTVNEPQSAWHQQIPVPRMIQNQLNHQLELLMVELDKKVLLMIQQRLKQRSRPMWVVTTLSVVLVLHIRELDAVRIIYWSRYVDSV